MGNVYCITGILGLDDLGEESFLLGVFENADDAMRACKEFDFEKFYSKRAEEISVVEREELGLLDLKSNWLDDGDLFFEAYDDEEGLSVDFRIHIAKVPLNELIDITLWC